VIKLHKLSDEMCIYVLYVCEFHVSLIIIEGLGAFSAIIIYQSL